MVTKTKRKVTVCRKQNTTSSYFPHITLTGKWLQDNGFLCGSKLEIEVEPDLMKIKPISKPEKQW